MGRKTARKGKAPRRDWSALVPSEPTAGMQPQGTSAVPDWRSFEGPGPEFDWQSERAGCPVGDRCEHCGVAEGLAVQLAWMGGEMACVTSCGPCDGKSVVTMLGGFGGYARRAAEHRTHRRR